MKKEIFKRAWGWGFLALVGVWLFGQFASEVREGETQSFDEAILRSLRKSADPAVPIGPPALRRAALGLTALGSAALLTLFTGMAAGFLVLRRACQATVWLVVAVGGGALLNLGLKRFFDRPRPSIVSHLEIVTNESFPSGHTLLATIAYSTLGMVFAQHVRDARLKRYIFASALVMAGSVGCSRVYLGVHYPTDVVAGWSVGLLWSWFCWFGFRHLTRKAST